MSTVRDDFLAAADSAVALLSDPAVAEQWREQSALRDYTTGGVAAHLADQFFHFRLLSSSSREPITLAEYFASRPWLGQDADEETNVAIRRTNEQAAAAGTDALLTSVRPALDDARALITEAPADRVVQMSLTGWALTLDDFLVTRLLELVVHADDLAVSAGIDTPSFPDSAVRTVVDLLSMLAIRRHGPQAVVRALTRSERAPETISAL